MSANTRWRVRVFVAHEEWRWVSAVTGDEAHDLAMREDGVIKVLSVKWVDYDEKEE